MSLRLYVFGSGSKGNALYVQHGNTRILVDCGIALRPLLHSLDMLGTRPSRLDAIFITHEHTDHVRSLNLLLKKAEIPVYASKATLKKLEDTIPKGNPYVMMNGDPQTVGAFAVDCTHVPHDAADTLSYHFSVGEHRLTIATDLGEVRPDLAAKLALSTCLVLESNHDEKLLETGSYPDYLKRRIRSTIGHLSNRQTAAALQPLRASGLKHVVLAHISAENNDPVIAQESAVNALDGSPATVHMTAQAMVGPFLDL